MGGQLVFGVESEYAAAFRRRGQTGTPLDQIHVALQALLRDVANATPSLTARPGGIFLANGARIYVDAGLHIEAATPECTSPDQLVSCVCACDQLLRRATDTVRGQFNLEDASLIKHNVDYLSGTTWGFHENYHLVRNPSENLAKFMVPFLATRLVYSGGGGFHQARFPELEFTLSPRTWFLKKLVSDSSQTERGIFHVKSESLTNGGDRMHVLCGENTCSHRSLWLRVGATALVATCLDHGFAPGDDVLLKHPLAAMQGFSLDPRLRHRAALIAGGRATALEIQRRYLRFVEAHASEPCLPDWTGGVLAVWAQTLDALESGSAATFLDWTIKLALYSDLLKKHDFSWQSFTAAGAALADRMAQWRKTRAPVRRDARAPTASHAALIEEFTASLEDQPPDGLSPRHYFATHARLLELDARFGRLGDGVFPELDRKGAVDHRLPGVTEASILNATRRPPRGTRARARGAAIRMLVARKRDECTCDWFRVADPKMRRVLDLADVFSTRPKWTGYDDNIDEDLLDFLGIDDFELRDPGPPTAAALEFYDHGRYEAAHAVLVEADRRLGPSARRSRAYCSVRVWVNARRGDLDATAQALNDLPPRLLDDLSYVADFVCAYRYLGLVPHDAIGTWITRGSNALLAHPDALPGTASPFLGHVAYWHLKCGRVEAAMECLEQAFRFDRIGAAHPHTVSRLYCERGEAHRHLGNIERARFDLAHARQLHTEHGFEGDLADFSLTYAAKAQSDPAEALDLLKQAGDIQRRLENEMGECRTLLLAARLDKEASAAQHLPRIREIEARRSALRRCPLFRKIMNHWEPWISGAPDPDGGRDGFWCL